MTTIHTLLANLRNGVQTRREAEIGGGVFLPSEQAELVQALEHQEELLRRCLAHLDAEDEECRRHHELIADLEAALA